jgi:phosphoglycolate phosphatase
MELPKDLKLLIFDFDGTLHDLGVDWQAVREAVGIHGTQERLGDAIERFKRDGDVTALQAISDLELRAVRGQALAPGVVAVLRDLSPRYALAIVSRNSRLAIERVLEGSGFEQTMIVGREDVRMLKPDPEGIQLVLERFGLRSAQAVLVGDTSHDVVAAQRAGLACIVVGDKLELAGGPAPTKRIADLSLLAEVLAPSAASA